MYCKGIRFLLVIFLTLTVSANVCGADYSKNEVWNFSTTGNSNWSGHNSGYCGACGSKSSAFNVYKTDITNFSNIDFSKYENVSLTIYVKAGTNSGTNSYTVKLIDANGNQVSTYTSTKSSGMGTGSNSSSAKESSVTFSPTVAFNGYKIEFPAKAYITQTRYVLTYDDKAASCTSINPSLSYTPSSLSVGGTANPTLSGNTGNGTVTYTSSNTSVATVNATGVITAKATGTVTITATIAANNGYCEGSATATITVNKQQTSITLSEAGSTRNPSGTFYVGDSYTLPSTTTATCGDKTFVGWSTVTIDNSAGQPASDFYECGASVTLGATNTFYAVFAETGGTPTTTWPKTDIANIKSTDEVVITMSNGVTTWALRNDYGTSAAPYAESITITNEQISSKVGDVQIWNISNSNGNLTIYPKGKTTTWLYCTDTNNGVRVGTNTNKTFTILGNYLQHTATDRYIGVYTANPDWRCYDNTTGNIKGQTLAFYKKTTTSGYQNYTTECSTPTEFTVSFDANDHGTAPDEQIVASGQKATEPTPAPTATGYTFGGWYKDQTCSNDKKFDFDTPITEDITLYAKWTAIQTTITLNANGGSGNTTSVAATYDSSTLNPSSITNPTKTGHTFGGWYSGEGGTGSLVINTSGKLQANVSGYTGANGVWKATTDKTLYAKWTPSVYTITYKDQGNTTFSGTHESGKPTQHTYGTETTLKGASKTGYTFGGWYKEAACTNKVTSLGATEYTANITLYAQWTANTYTVEFNANGGTGTMDNQSFTYDQSKALSANAFTRTNYAFKNWNTKFDGTGTNYTNQQSVSNLTAENGATVTLYAQWTPTYTITWLANGQEFHKQENAVEGTALDVPDSEPDASEYACDDKVFVGWTASQIDGSTDTEPADLFTTKNINVEEAATTYYAVFATADAGGSTTDTYDWESDQTENWTVDAAITRTQSQGVDESYAGKINTNNTYVTYNNKVAVTNFSFDFKRTSNNTNYKVYIETSTDNSTWISAASYEMSSFGNGSYTSKSHTFDGTQDLYVRFHCYNTTAIRYVDNVSITYGGGTSYSEYVTTCVQVIKYNVTYNIGDGATGTAPTETSKAEGTIFTLASADGISKEGYSFAGWLCDNDSKKYGASEEYTMPAADVTFTAQWNELPKYTVTFNNKGKKHSEVAQTIANAPIECPTGLVACDGYTFAGWSTEELDGVSTFSKIEGEYTPTEDITLYAVYAEGNVTTNGWVKVTDLSTITEGTYALLSNNYYAFNGTINNNSDGEHTTNSFVFNGEGVATEAPSGTCEIELIASGDGFKMYSEGKGYLYAKAPKSGNLAWSQTENSSWSWNSTKSNWVYAENTAFLRSYNNTFRTYGTNNGNAIFFAKKNITSFTTSPACDPMITIGSEAPVMVTSAKDIRVDAVQNITISATNLDQNADKAQVSIKIVSDNSAFKFKEVDANGDGQATLTWTGIANATFDKTLCVTYTPTEAGQEETATLTVTAYRHNGSTEYATATMQVRGRSLPEQFVLVANTGDGWVALPNTLGTGSTASIPYPIAVEVDNDPDPTSIPLAPSTTIYKAAARSTVNAIPTGLRFTTETGGYMQASTTETNIWLASNNSENMQSWTLNSTDFVDYSIRVNNAAEGHYLNYSNTQKKIGNYKSDNKLRILPIEDICEQHAAPENIDVVSVSANAATIQWDAVATATLGYEYRIGATGEWTKVGNVTELELTKLSSLTNYIVYVRASVEGTNTNCSYEAEAEFTTLNCDDVPYDIHYASGANSVTVYWTCEAATSTISLYHDKEGMSLVETKTSVTSPCQFTGLDKFTTYYVQIQAGGSCPSGMIQVSTEQLDLDVVEWMSDGVVVDVNTDETITVTLENEVQYGSGVGQKADDLFFSKYFEGSGNLKLLAIYNGTGKDVDLSTYRIDRGSNGNATKIGKIYNLSQLGTIKNGQEIIFYTKPSSGEYPYTCSQSFLASKVNESGVDANPRWILCDATEHNGVNFETMDFNGDDPLLLYKGNTLIDVFGVSTAAEQPSKKTQCSGRTENSWSAAKVTNMDYGKTEADFEDGKVPEGVDLLNPTITAYTARVIMFRKNTVLSGSNAVAENITDFVTLASEWEVRSVCKDGDDGNLTCGAYQELGKFDYADYYTKYETIAGEQGFDENARLEDGTIKIRIPNLSTYSCKNIKFNVKVGGVTINEVTKVPILIANEQSTNGGEVFTNLKTTLGTMIVNGSEVTIQPLDDEQLLEKCEACDVVVLASGKLTHEADGISHFDDLTIYPNGVFLNTSDFTVNSLLVHAKLDTVGFAVIENEGVTLATNTIAHTKRIDAQYWYPFSLPYNCNIADITQANGESMGEYGVHWGIQYYNGEKRQQSGTSAGAGQSSKFWTPMEANAQLKACQGYVIALFDAAVEKETDMRTIYFPPATAQMYTESGTDSKESTITSWNVNLAAEKRHHGWNFTGSPYISVFNPQASGLTEDYGLAAEVLMISGHYDPSTNEYLYDDNNVYVSIPTPNGAKYYDQYIASATSLKPFTAYFVQAIDPTSGNDETQTLAYAKMGRELPSSAPRRAASSIQPVLVELNVTAPDGQTDNTGIWVDERYTTDYEIAADLSKMYVAGTKPQLYTIGGDNEMLAYNALPDAGSEYIQLGLYAPMTGNYTLALNNRVSRLNAAETVELLYNNKVVANLFYEDYVITANKGTVSSYALRIKRRANVTTATDNVTGQNIQVVVSEGTMTIEGLTTGSLVRVYDMLGRQVYTETANEDNTLMTPAVPQGVYNISVLGNGGNTTFKVVVK